MIQTIDASIVSVQMLLCRAFLEENSIDAGGCQGQHIQERDCPKREPIRFKHELCVGGGCIHDRRLIDF